MKLRSPRSSVFATLLLVCASAAAQTAVLATPAAQAPSIAVRVPVPLALPMPMPAAALGAEGASEVRLERLHAFMRRATADGGYTGAVTLVARHGRIVDWQAVGAQDIARSRPMRRDAIFRIYSMTKTVTTVAALLLMEEGRLNLEDPVARTLPEFAGAQVMTAGTADAPQLRAPARPMTIRHLLTHTAGLATGGSNAVDAAALQLMERAAPQQGADLQQFAERVSRVPLAADPGTRFNYDGVGIEVLSRLIEVVSGQPFAVFLEQRIFVPLKMVDTGFSVPADQRQRIVELTTMATNRQLVRAATRSAAEPGVMLSAYASGAGGLYSTAGDYLRFCQMLLNGGALDGVSLLSRKTVELMFANHLTQLTPPVNAFSDAEGFGLGGSVLIDVARRGRPGSLGAFGWSGAASTYYMIDPKEQLIALLLMQHLPPDDAPGAQPSPDLPKISATFYNLVYQALD